MTHNLLQVQLQGIQYSCCLCRLLHAHTYTYAHMHMHALKPFICVLALFLEMCMMTITIKPLIIEIRKRCLLLDHTDT